MFRRIPLALLFSLTLLWPHGKLHAQADGLRLVISMYPPFEAVANTPLEVSAWINNYSDVPATGVEMRYKLDVDASVARIVEANLGLGSGLQPIDHECSISATSVVCSLQELFVNSAGSVWLKLQVLPLKAGSTIGHSAYVSADQNEEDLSDNTTSRATSITQAFADLYVEGGCIRHPIALNALNPSELCIDVGNLGPSPTDVTLRITTDPMFAEIFSAPNNDACRQHDHELICQIAGFSMPTGDSNFRIQLSPPAFPAKVPIRAYVEGTLADPRLSNNTTGLFWQSFIANNFLDLGTQDLDPGSGVYRLEFAPDGEHAYLLLDNDSVVVATVAGEDGALTRIAEQLDVFGAIATTGQSVSGERFIAVSPDGQHLYLSSLDLGEIRVFEIGAAGQFSLSQVFNDIQNYVNESSGPGELIFSRDGKFAYLEATRAPSDAMHGENTDPAIFALSRNVSSGSLSVEQKLSSGSYVCCPTPRQAMALSLDESILFVAVARRLRIYERDTESGRLSEVSDPSFVDGQDFKTSMPIIGVHPILGNLFGLDFDGDISTAYEDAEGDWQVYGDYSTSILDRDPETGRLRTPVGLRPEPNERRGIYVNSSGHLHGLVAGPSGHWFKNRKATHSGLEEFEVRDFRFGADGAIIYLGGVQNGVGIIHRIGNDSAPTRQVIAVRSHRGEIDLTQLNAPVDPEILGFTDAFSSFGIQFDGPVLKPGAETELRDLEHYRLYAAGPNNIVDSNSCERKADDESVEINFVNYGLRYDEVVIWPAPNSLANLQNLVDLPIGKYGLAVCASLLTHSRQALDGNADGLPGDDFFVQFEIGPGDSDRDGEVGAVDSCPNTFNANDSDRDLDGILDLCDLDNDNDGLSDLEELKGTTDPYLFDSDCDGLSDKAELDGGFDPNDGMCPVDLHQVPLTPLCVLGLALTCLMIQRRWAPYMQRLSNF